VRGNTYDIGKILCIQFALWHSHPYKYTQNFQNMRITYFDVIIFQDTGNRYDIPLQTLNSFTRNEFLNLREVKLGKASCHSEKKNLFVSILFATKICINHFPRLHLVPISVKLWLTDGNEEGRLFATDHHYTHFSRLGALI
jgi:hypothetical protein